MLENSLKLRFSDALAPRRAVIVKVSVKVKVIVIVKVKVRICSGVEFITLFYCFFW